MAFLDRINFSTSVVLRRVAMIIAPHSLENRRKQCRQNLLFTVSIKQVRNFNEKLLTIKLNQKVHNFNNLKISGNTATFIVRD
jgi:hypothetical protein